jgi:NAD(P)-dependent dehydrogenase (short-subunit alcohol dehydrogenase family)
MIKSFLDLFKLENKVAVILGGTGVIGQEIALGLGKAGAKVAVCARNMGKINKTINILSKFKINSKGYYVDVMEKEKIIKCRDQIYADFNKVDILVNAAGGNLKGATTSDELSFFDLDIKELKEVIDLNLFGGAILPAQIFGRNMAQNTGGGSIINISSMTAFRPLTRVPGYSAAKAAVSNFTQWLSVHFCQNYNKNLRVNAIAPGFFLTNQNHYLLFDNDEKLTHRGQQIISHTPMGEFGKTEDLVGACIWLASDASRFVTGTVILIDGGFSAYSGV